MFIVFGLLATQALASIPAQPKTVLVYGDSLSAAYGLKMEDGWVSFLQEKLQQSKSGWVVKNVSISGETTSGGLSRLPAVLEAYKPDLMLLELGANDGLRGTPLNAMRNNLAKMIEMAHKRGVTVALFEMQIPPNYGPVYTRRFTKTFHDLAKEYNAVFIPFFLNGVAGISDLNQADGIHPTAKAQSIIFDNVWLHLKPLLEESSGRIR